MKLLKKPTPANASAHSFLKSVGPAVVAGVLILACDNDNTAADAAEAPGATIERAMTSSDGLPSRNPALASQGESLFTARACVSCHTVGGGRLVGPDLEGVTARRSRQWVVAMMLNPDSMLRADTTARRLLGEYMTPMVNQGLSSDDAVALYEYLVVAGEKTQGANGNN